MLQNCYKRDTNMNLLRVISSIIHCKRFNAVSLSAQSQWGPGCIDTSLMWGTKVPEDVCIAIFRGLIYVLHGFAGSNSDESGALTMIANILLFPPDLYLRVLALHKKLDFDWIGSMDLDLHSFKNDSCSIRHVDERWHNTANIWMWTWVILGLALKQWKKPKNII